MIMARQIERNTNHLSRQVVKMAQECLSRSAEQGIGTIACHFEAGVLFLRGKLPSFYHKQLAQEAVRDVTGVNQVVNQIEVKPI